MVNWKVMFYIVGFLLVTNLLNVNYESESSLFIKYYASALGLSADLPDKSVYGQKSTISTQIASWYTESAQILFKIIKLNENFILIQKSLL